MSWSAVIGMMPYRLIRPTVGLTAASRLAFAGLRIDPEVSVPTFAAQKLAAVPVPELEPPVASAGRPSKVASLRIAPRVVGVEAVAVQGVVVGRHAGWPRDPVGELGHLRLGEDDRARGAQVRDQRRLVRRDEAGERQCAAGGRHVRGVDVVLERDRDAMQRTAHLARPALAVEGVGLVEGARIDRDRGVDPVFVEGDAQQVLRHQLARGDPPGGHRRLHLRNRRLDDLERFACPRRRAGREQCEQEGPKPSTGMRLDASFGHLFLL